MKLQIIDEKYRYIDKVNALALNAFPYNEYLAPSILIKMAKEEQFTFLAIEENDDFIGFVALQFYHSMCYLFFLAIVEEYRFHGYGSRIIQWIMTTYKQYSQVVDIEKQDDTALNKEERQKRKAFYLKNGYQETGLYLNYLNVDYEVLSNDDHFDVVTFQELMSHIVLKDLNPKFYREDN